MAEAKKPKGGAGTAKAGSAKAAPAKAVAKAKHEEAAAPKAAAPKAELPKVATPKAAAPKAELPKAVAPKVAAPVAAAPQAAAPKAAAPPAGRTASPAPGPKVKVRLVRSGIGTPKDQRATLKGLGLSRLRQERELQDSPSLRGMLVKVRHLVSVDGQPAA